MHIYVVSSEIMYISIKMMQRHQLMRRGSPWLQELLGRPGNHLRNYELWPPSLLEPPLFILSDLLKGLPPPESRWLLDLVGWLLLFQKCFFKIINWFAWETNILLPSSLYTMAVIRHPLLFLDSYKDRYSTKNQWFCVRWSTENQDTEIVSLQNTWHVMWWVK